MRQEGRAEQRAAFAFPEADLTAAFTSDGSYGEFSWAEFDDAQMTPERLGQRVAYSDFALD